MENRGNISEKILKKAIDGLDAWELEGLNIDEFLDSRITEEEAIRGTVSSILFSYFRNKAVIDWTITEFAKEVKPKFRRILSVVLTQTFFQSGIAPESAVNVAVDYTSRRFGRGPSGFVNGVMRNILRQEQAKLKEKIPPETALNIPRPILKRWEKNFGREKTEFFAGLLKAEAPLTFRAVTELDKAELEKIGAKLLDCSEWGSGFPFYECSNSQGLFAGKWLEEGKIYIQDPATSLVHALASPRLESTHKMLDLCAAPGGKSLMFAGKIAQGNLTASDRSLRRQKLTIQNFRKHKCDASVLVADALNVPFQENTFDFILLDLPCSNTAVFRRRPDALWAFSEKKLSDLLSLQGKMLEAASKLLKKGGFLVYSTCSMEPEENNEQIAAFLAKNEKFKLIEEKLLHPSASHDGAYSALIACNA
ncbi:MAG: hypothetical protein A2017_14970 [Lentisphaerae bacterium GWF2_44_16]|nr:MAG: hypothetical protein A2017_14970 [Lentisphaerae bacterium GWF2_44_16]